MTDSRPKPNNPKSKKRSVQATLAGVLAFLTVVGGILTQAGNISVWFQRLLPKNPKDPYVVKVSHASVVPSYLKYYYDSEGLGKQQSLYWLRAKVENKTSESLNLEVSFKVVPTDCKFVTLSSKEPYVSSLLAGESKEETINPALDFLNPDFEGDCYLKINWIIEDDQKQKAYKKVGDADIKLLPLHTVKWDLVNPNNEAVPREFLLASLAAWSLSKNGAVVKRADQLQTRTGALSPEQWVSLCYENLFGGPSSLAIYPTRRTYPFTGETTVATPSQVLSENGAEPLEASLLMAAMIHAAPATNRARLTLFVLPQAEDPHNPAILLAWSLPNSHTWQAIDLREARKLGFKANLDQTGKLVRQVLDQHPDIIKSLRAQGVFSSAEANSATVVSFDRAVIKFEIRAFE